MEKEKIDIKKQQLEKIDILIGSWIREIWSQNEAFNIIDKKSMWLFTILSASQIFLINSYFLPKNYDFFETKSFLLTILLILGTITLWLILHNINSKSFEIWPWLDEQKSKFGGKEKTVFDLKQDSLQSYKNSVIKNKKTIWKKSKNFKINMWLTYWYYFILIIYLIIYKICVI